MGRRNLDPQLKEKAEELERQGIHRKVICRKLDCSMATLYKRLGARKKAQEQRSEPETASVPVEN